MNTTAITYFLAAFTFTTSALIAETPYERDMKQLQDQRTKTLAAAIEPINRRYKESMEQLLKRATQGGDLDTALKIKTELGALIGTTVVGPSLSAGASALGRPVVINPQKIYIDDGAHKDEEFTLTLGQKPSSAVLTVKIKGKEGQAINSGGEILLVRAKGSPRKIAEWTPKDSQQSEFTRNIAGHFNEAGEYKLQFRFTKPVGAFITATLDVE